MYRQSFFAPPLYNNRISQKRTFVNIYAWLSGKSIFFARIRTNSFVQCYKSEQNPLTNVRLCDIIESQRGTNPNKAESDGRCQKGEYHGKNRSSVDA